MSTTSLLRPRSGWYRTICSAVAATLLAAPCFTTPAFATPCELAPEPAPVDLGNLPMSFAETSPGRFTGAGIGGHVSYDEAGLRLRTAEIDGAVASATLELNFAGAKADSPVVGNKLDSSRLSLIAKGEARTLTSYRTLEQRQLFEAVDLSISASQRRLDLDFAGSSESLSQVRFQIAGAGAIVTREKGSQLVIGLGDGSRQLTVELVALDLADGRENRIDGSFTVDREGTVGLRIDPVQGAARAILTTLFSPYQEAVAAPTTREGGRLAIANVPTGEGRRQLMIAELGKGGRSVRGTTLIDTGRDLEVEDAVLDADGRLVLAGSHGGEQSDGLGEGRTTSAFVATFDPERQTLTESAAFGGLVEGTVHGLTTTDEGRVVVTGFADQGFVSINRKAARFTLVAPVDRRSEPRRLFVAELDPTLERLTWATELETTLPPAALRARVDCKGELVIGIPNEPKSLLVVDHTYSIALPSSAIVDCPMIELGWGYGAMCWKWQHGVPSWDYVPANVDAQHFPVLLVENPDNPGFTADYQRLNQLEKNQHGNLFFNPDENEWQDPSGGWNGPDNWAFSKAEIAVAGAIYHSRWNSPVFTNFRLDDGTNPPAPVAVMMRSETFSADSLNEMPHNACDEDTDGDGHSDFSDDPYPLPPEHQVAAACVSAHGSEFELKSIDYDTWQLGAYVPDQTVQGSDSGWWPFFGTYVGDPPVPGADGASADHILEISRRLRRQAQVTADLQVLTIEAGVIQAEQELCAKVAMMDLEVASE